MLNKMEFRQKLNLLAIAFILLNLKSQVILIRLF